MIERREIVDYFREYEELRVDAMRRELEVPVDSDFIISIIGPRRAGKTYYLFLLRERLSNSLYLNFEDSRLYDTTYKDIREIMRIFIENYGRTPEYLLLDEIQNVAGWEIAVRELHDLRRYKIFITGSSSKLLSKEIATQLRGRALTYLLLPFSFREFLKAKNMGVENLTRDEEAKVRNMLREYLEYGGFPDVVKNDYKVNILREYSDLILFRDFIERHRIRSIEVARALHSYIIQNFSREISVRRIYNRLKSSNMRVSKDYVYSYVTKLEDTLFFYFLNRYSKKVHIRESWPKKVYLCDTGITKVLKYTEDYGRLMENAVFLELLRRRNSYPLWDIYYYRTRDYEVDFVVKEGERIKECIQVTYASSKDEVERREIRALEKASEELECKKKTVITWDYEEEGKIKYIPLWKWLLEKLVLLE